jgi:hypothetical protein
MIMVAPWPLKRGRVAPSESCLAARRHWQPMPKGTTAVDCTRSREPEIDAEPRAAAGRGRAARAGRVRRHQCARMSVRLTSRAVRIRIAEVPARGI